MDDIFEIRLGDPRYPKLLASSLNAPKSIFVRGNLDLLNAKCLAIVGTRQPTLVGRVLALRQFEGLDAEIAIISGLAVGIDTIAHSEALKLNRKTIAVLPIGITDESIVPLENRELVGQILKEGGLLISPYREGEAKDVKSKYYLERNRVIAGMAEKIVGIEAKPRSGTLFTVQFGSKLGREVWLNYRGRNELLLYINKEGGSRLPL